MLSYTVYDLPSPSPSFYQKFILPVQLQLFRFDLRSLLISYFVSESLDSNMKGVALILHSEMDINCEGCAQRHVKKKTSPNHDAEMNGTVAPNQCFILLMQCS